MQLTKEFKKITVIWYAFPGVIAGISMNSRKTKRSDKNDWKARL